MIWLRLKKFLLKLGIHKYLKKLQFFIFDILELLNKIKNYNINWKKNFKEYKISFCTTCKNRSYDLKETYLQNILNNSNYKNSEFILINYNSEDDLDKWVKKNLKEYIKSGKVKYYKNNTFKTFIMGHAKNCSHKFATGNILVNLDADNLTGEGFASYINEIFNKYRKVVVVTNTSDGSNGRVCVKKEDFYSVNGYDERFIYASDESDFIWRVKNKNKLFSYRIKDKKFLKFYSYKEILSRKNNKLVKNIQKEHEERHNQFLEDKKIFIENKKSKLLIANNFMSIGKGVFKKID